MSAELLRQAATILRERAEAATPGPWKLTAGFRSHDDDRVYVVPTGGEEHYVCAGGALGVDEDAPYIATVHPGVGLAIADWLDEAAAQREGQRRHLVVAFGDDKADDFMPDLPAKTEHLARLIVGEQ